MPLRAYVLPDGRQGCIDTLVNPQKTFSEKVLPKTPPAACDPRQKRAGAPLGGNAGKLNAACSPFSQITTAAKAAIFTAS